MYSVLILFAILLFTACSVDDTFDDYDLQGHRGARGLMPENTIPGFLKAIDLGVDTIEFDVVITAENQVLISHDPWFNYQISTKPDGTPVTEEEQEQLNIYRMTYEEIEQYDVGQRGHPDFPEQESMEVSKPLVKKAILAIEKYIEEQELDPVRYNIEMKTQPDWYREYTPLPDRFAQILYDELSDLEILDRVTIQSFDPFALRALHEINADVKQAMLIHQEGIVVQDYLKLLGYTPEIWSPDFKLVTTELVDEVHGLGMFIIPWTINDTEEMKRQLEMGVDGIITDYPNRAP